MNKKYTVIQVLPSLESGGVERGTLEVGKFLIKKGHRSIVISSGGRMVNRLINEGSEHVDLSVGKKSLLTIFLIPFLVKFIKKNKVDIVHVRSRFPAWIFFIALKFIPKNRKPSFITTFHGQYSVNTYSAIMAKGDLVIVVSKMIKKYVLSNYKIDREVIRLNYRGIDPADNHLFYNPSKVWLEKWHTRYPFIKNKIVITLPARITRWKGQEDFIDLIAKLKVVFPNIHGLVVGETKKGKEYFLDELRNKANNLGVIKDITFTGHRSDIKNIMAISKIVFSLSKQPEAFGRVSLESLSMGIPVIAYSHGGVKEQLQKLLPSGLVTLNNKALLFQKAKDFILNPPVLQKNTYFLLDNMLKNTLNIYIEAQEKINKESN